MTSSYNTLGIKRVINANATLTKLGGSLMPEEVIKAMVEASKTFVDIHQLQQTVGQRLAELTRNEAAYVSCGAATGLLLATAACIEKKSKNAYERFPQWGEISNEVIVQKMHRNSYDYAILEAGASIVEIGNQNQTLPDELENAISTQTIAVFWFQGAMNQPSELSLDQVIEICRPKNIPVIVDAAAQLPPASNFWNFTHQGADLAIFSGGKDLSGPQASGLILGSKELIEIISELGAPHHGIGRPMKVGKEEMMGLLAAVERYLSLDHEQLFETYEARVTYWINELDGLKGLRAIRDYPNEAGQPVARTKVVLPESHNKDNVIQDLLQGEPMISVAPSETENALLLNPMTVKDGEPSIIKERILEVMG